MCTGVQLYASYGARFEGRIVQQLIRSDGGTGLFHEKQLSMRSTWDSLVAVRFQVSCMLVLPTFPAVASA